MSESRMENQRFRFAERSDIPVLKLMWQLCFGDEERYIDFYFNQYFHREKVLLLMEGDEIASMLTMVPVSLVSEKGESYEGAMLYAIATHPEFQNRGLAARLMAYSSEYLKEKNKDFSVLVPAEASLYGFYEKKGYQKAFYLREAMLEKSHIERRFDEMPALAIGEITAEEYNIRRKAVLQGNPYLAYGNREAAYQKKLSQQYGGGLYSIDMGETQGCFLAERVDDYRVIIKELLLPEEFLAGAVRQIASMLPADKYLVRTPAFLGETLGGITRPFAMIKPETVAGIQAIEEISFRENSYLGIAFD